MPQFTPPEREATIQPRPSPERQPGSPERTPSPGGAPAPRRLLWWSVAGVAVVLVVVLAFVLLGGSGKDAGAPAASGSATQTGEARFAFPDPQVVVVRVTKTAPADDVSGPVAQVRATLDALYGGGIVDRARWRSGPPASVWNAFAPDIRDQARADRTAFTLGDTGVSLQSLDISSSRLTIRFLMDEKGHATSAVVTSVITGEGTVKGSGPVILRADARFLFEPVDGAWLITGYPHAAVVVTSPDASGAPATPTTAPTVGTGTASP